MPRTPVTRLFATLLVAVGLAGCTIDNQAAPPLTGPSGYGLSVTLVATPDQLPRDGSSQSTITVTVRDAQGRPVSGQRLSVGSSVGSVSQSDVVTNADGRATFTFTAPTSGVVGNTAIIQVLPVGGNFDNATATSVSILLMGTSNRTAPTPAFTVSPAAPVVQEPVTLDATTSTDEGIQCRDACTYTWDFGGEATATGRVVTYRFRAARTYGVKLTVTDAAGSSASLTQSVVVGTGTLPTAVFTFSPAAPGQFETVQFNASQSVAGSGRTITTYQWDFGDGTTGTGVTASHAFQNIGSGDSGRSQTFTVTLTVTDSAALQNTVSHDVAVVSGVSAVFTISDPPATLTVIFNAEESRGSSNGFGGRNPITKYIWHFGDSENTEEKSSPITSHTFPGAGAYTVTLTVEDSAGRRETTSKSFTAAN